MLMLKKMLTENVFIDNSHTYKSYVDEIIRRLEGENIKDYAAFSRTGKNNKPYIVVYVVLSSQSDVRNFNKETRYLFNNGVSILVIFVSSIPLLNSGEIDKDQLFAIAYIDSSIINFLKDELNNLSDHWCEVVLEEMINDPVYYDSKSIINRKTSYLEPVSHSDNHASTIRPSFVEGKPLSLLGAPRNLQLVLQLAAQTNNGINFINAEEDLFYLSYKDLYKEANELAGFLDNNGLKSGQKIVFQFNDNKDFIVSFWACILGGFVPIPLPLDTEKVSSDQVTKLDQLTFLLNDCVILTVSLIKEKLMKLLDRGIAEKILTIDNFKINASNRHVIKESEFDDLTLLLLTSGSTGTPKLVSHTHKTLIARCLGSMMMNDFKSTDVSLNWFPLDHVGGLVMFHLHDVFLKCQQIQVSTNLILQNPILWLKLIDRFKATITWAPNFAYNIINSLEDKILQEKLDLSSMRFILNGGEAIIVNQAKKFLEILIEKHLSETAMHPAWGMSETASGVVFSDDFSLETAGDNCTIIGKPIPGCSLRIVDEKDEVVNQGINGYLQVKGESITPGYYLNDKLNNKSFTKDGWFKTGDLGVISNDFLSITGRSKDVVIINGLNYYTHEIEAFIESLDGVEPSYTAVINIRNEQNSSDSIVVFFVPKKRSLENTQLLISQIKEKVLEYTKTLPALVLPLEENNIPKTSIGKIQKTKLKEVFEQGYFKETVNKHTSFSKREGSIPNWFFHEKWFLKNHVAENDSVALKCAVIIADQYQLNNHLIKELQQKKGCQVVYIEPFSCFKKAGDLSFKIDITCKEDYVRMFKELEALNIRPDTIFHLCSYGEQEGLSFQQKQTFGPYSLLALTQSLMAANIDKRRINLFCITSNAQYLPGDRKVDVAKLSINALLKTAAQEINWLNTSIIDFDTINPNVHLKFVFREIQAYDLNSIIAYRNKSRYIRGLEKADLERLGKQEQFLKKNGTYVLVGGSGGIGKLLAAFLLKNYSANLVIVSRNKSNNRIQNNSEHKVIYEYADVCDAEGMEKVIKHAENMFQQKIDGIFHLSGVLKEGYISDITPQDLEESYEAKILGTQILHELCRKNSISSLVCFSSINGFFGGTNVGSYAAANGAQQTICAYLRDKSPDINVFCLSWSMWSKTGMSSHYNNVEDVIQLRGFYTITPQQALTSLEVCFSQKFTNVLIGLNGGNKNIKMLLFSTSIPLEKIGIHIERGDINQFHAVFSKLADKLLDPFGNRVKIDLIKKEKPKRNYLSETYLDFQNSLTSEQNVKDILTRIWENLLDIHFVSDEENFFDLGGHSLLIPKFQEEIFKQTQVKLSPIHFFQHPTIKSLVPIIQSLKETPHKVVSILEQIELKIRKIWIELLDLRDDEFNEASNFFDLGGNSLLLPKLQDSFNKTFSINLQIIDFFRFPTISKLAQHVNNLVSKN